MNFNRIPVADDVNVGALRTTLKRSERYQTKIVPGVHEEMSVDELVGKETAVFVVEDGFQLIGSGGDINLIVNGEELTAGDFGGVVSVERFYGQIGGSFAQFIEDLGQLVLWKRENHSDWLNFGDDQKTVGIRGVDDIAGIDEAKADASGNWSCDPGVGEL